MRLKKILSVILCVLITFTTMTVPIMAEENTVLPEVLIINNIAEKYSNSGVENDGNMHWFISDFASYNQLYPESAFALSDVEKQKCVDKIIEGLSESNDLNYISKSIIALRALGYDAKNITTRDFEKIDAVKKITDLIDMQSSTLENVYTLPWVIVALWQSNDYANDIHLNYVINKAIELKSEWQNTDWGTDAATYMIFALSPYYNTNDIVKSAVNETIPIINDFQGDDGLICTSFFGQLTPSAESTALTIAAYSSIGIDSSLVKNENGKNLIEGLLSYTTDSFDGFNPTTNSFATEQGFRGLIAYQFYKNNIGKRLYDFSSNPLNPAVAAWAQNCPVEFDLIPASSSVTIDGFEQIAENKYDMQPGTYSYVVKKSGYKDKSGTFTVSDEDATNHTKKLIEVKLNKKQTGSEGKIKITLSVLSHDENECNNSFTYKNDSSNYSEIVSDTIRVNKGESVLDVLIKILDDNRVDYENEEGYISSIDGISAFDHGRNSGWMFMVNGAHKNTGASETILRSNSNIVWFYTDDYLSEHGSEDFSGTTANTITYVVNFNSNSDVKYEKQIVERYEYVKEVNIPQKEGYIFEGWYKDAKFREKYDFNSPVKSDFTLYAKWKEDIKVPFTDTSEHKNEDAIKYLYHNGIISGKTETEFEPDNTMTRAEFATIVAKALSLKTYNAAGYDDVFENDWYYDYINAASYFSIIKGVGNNKFNPNALITREQAITMIERTARVYGLNTALDGAYSQIILAQFSDYKEISDWAYNAFAYCVDKKILDDDIIELKPFEFVTRAEIAQILYNLIMIRKSIEL